MFNKKNLKITAVALASVMSFGLVGMTATSAEAASHHHSYDYRSHDRHHHRDYNRDDSHSKKYSAGERNTAAVVGAIIGAVIAKNT